MGNGFQPQEGLEDQLQKVTDAIVQGYRPDRIILFGSAARGRFREGSDLDLLIIKETPEKPMERIREVVNYLPHTIDTDLLVLTPSEITARRQEKNYFLEEILHEGRILYERGKA